MKQLLRQTVERAKTAAIGSALNLLGLSGVIRSAQGRLEHEGLILMFHHVRPRGVGSLGVNAGMEITPETLERVLTSLREQGYDIVSMDDVPALLARGIRGHRRFAALTFDDGGRDNLIHAAPILRRHEAPFTVYVTTGFASGAVAPWWYVVERAAMAATSLMIDDGHKRRSFDTSDHRSKRQAAEALQHIMWRSSNLLRERQTLDLAQQAGIDLSALTRELYMDWDELAEIAAIPGCTIGAHTTSHAKLAQLDDASAMREIIEARDIIRERLMIEVNHFAYPYGAAGCCDAREYDLARKAGFATAVTTRRGVLAPANLQGLACLPRVPINGLYQQPRMINALISGLPMALAARSSALLSSFKNCVRARSRLPHQPRRLLGMRI